MTRRWTAGWRRYPSRCQRSSPTDLRLNEATLLDAAEHREGKKKQLDNLKPADLGVDVTPRLTTLKVEEPPKRQGGVRWRTSPPIDKLRTKRR